MIYQPGILVGQIIKIHGYEGVVIVRLEKLFIENVREMESVFLEIDGKPVPFFISASEYEGNDILKLRFEGYDSFDRVKGLKGCKLYLTENIKTGKIEDSIPDLTGFKVILKDKSEAGTIAEIIKNPGQWLLRVNSAIGVEILIPFHEDLIIRIDKNQKLLQMDLPEGLTEIN